MFLYELISHRLNAHVCVLCQEFTDVHHVDIVSKAELKIHPSLNIQQLSTHNDDTRVNLFYVIYCKIATFNVVIYYFCDGRPE